MKILMGYIVLIIAVLTWNVLNIDRVTLQSIEPNIPLKETLGLDLSDGALSVINPYQLTTVLETFNPAAYIMESDSSYLFIRNWNDYDQLILDRKANVTLSGYLLEDDAQTSFLLITYQVKDHLNGKHLIKLRHANNLDYDIVDLSAFWTKNQQSFEHETASIHNENEDIVDQSNRDLRGYVYEGVILIRINQSLDAYLSLDVDFFTYHEEQQSLILGFNQFKKNQSGYIPQRIRLVYQEA